MLQQDGTVAAARVAEKAGGTSGEEQVLKKASRFGAWRARQQLRLALRLGRGAMGPLHDANPIKVTVRSIIDRFDEATSGLPGRGVMPLDPNAPLVTLCEALWMIVAALMAAYVAARLGGYHPIYAATGHHLHEWLEPWLL